MTDVLVRLKPKLASRDNVEFRVTLNGIALHQDTGGAYQLAQSFR